MSSERFGVRANLMVGLLSLAVLVVAGAAVAQPPKFSEDFSADIVAMDSGGPWWLWPFAPLGGTSFGLGFPGVSNTVEGRLFNDHTGQRSRFALPDDANPSVDVLAFYDRRKQVVWRDGARCRSYLLLGEMPDFYSWVGGAEKLSTPCRELITSGKTGFEWVAEIHHRGRGRTEYRHLCSAIDNSLPYWTSWTIRDRTVVLLFSNWNPKVPDPSNFEVPEGCRP
jgi:hypothetical protein